MKKTFFNTPLYCFDYEQLPVWSLNRTTKQEIKSCRGGVGLCGGGRGGGSLKVDEINGGIFVSHGTVAQAIDIKTGKLVGTIPDTKGIHGIAIANDLNKGFYQQWPGFIRDYF